MSGRIIPGGEPVPQSGGRVATDQTTIIGDGTSLNPLSAKAGGTSVVTDGVTIAGVGTTGDPLHTVADKTAVLSDGTSIAGNGVTGTPLHTIAGGTAVTTDATLVGNGVTGTPLGVAPAVQLELAIAVANVAANGTVTASRGFASIVRSVAGQYVATLNVAPPTGDVVPITTIDSAAGVAIALAQAVAGGVINIRTVAAADFAVGTTSDVAFYLAVFRTA